ncbi:carbonic anhydrase 2-like [Symsagittifera roscoffensis]|uniref:carbonic anhydrase 2-like n=1 Tax=Symsagittifera roscoffensis TaxID=84072 RepID=UPI00307BF020
MSFDNSWHHKEQFSWPKQFPLSINGKRQSPIDIRECDAEKVLLPRFKLELVEGDRHAEWTLTNNGHTICVAPPSGVKWQLSGSMLKGNYILDHFHTHWGEGGDYGCEHLIDGQKHSGETHFVFKWAPGQGKEVEDVAAVWGIFMDEGPESDPAAADVFDEGIGCYIHKVLKPGSVQIPAVNFGSLVPHGTSEYFAYQGSLTTPPFAEVVFHIVFKDPIRVAKKYMDQLRRLGDLRNEKTEANYRWIQPLNGRKIFWSC